VEVSRVDEPALGARAGVGEQSVSSFVRRAADRIVVMNCIVLLRRAADHG